MQTIYILDYDIDIAYGLCAWFKLNGFEAKHFSTLEQLLVQLQTHQPDCLMLDCLFGRIALISDICNNIKQVFNYNGSILLTSTSNISAKDLVKCNATAFIPKPFDFGKILQLVNQVSQNSLIESIG